MRKWLVVVLPFVVIVGGGLAVRGLLLWSERAPWDRAPTVDVDDFGDLHLGEPNVRLRGMAHYEMVVRQTIPASMVSQERTLFLFALFPRDDTSGRAIRVLVRTERVPPKLISYENMTIEGRLRPPTAEVVPFGTEVSVGKRSDYWFDDGMLVLEPWRISADGEVWTAPGFNPDGRE